MSNRIVIQPTKFINLPDELDVTFGVRVYDDSGQSYDNSWSEMPLSIKGILSKTASTGDEVILDMLDFAKLTGLYVGDTWLTGDEVSVLLNNLTESD